MDDESLRDWIQAAVSRRWRGAEVLTLEGVAGDASSRRYLRCVLAGGPSGTPRSTVVMIAEGSRLPMSSDELGVFGGAGPGELPFLNVGRFLRTITDAVPEVYASSDDQVLVMMEDLGNTALWDAAVSAGDESESLFTQAIVLLGHIQSRARDDGSGCYAFLQAFDERLFAWEFEHFIEYGLEEAPPTAVQACRAELLDAAARLADSPRVFCHRDYHAWNIMVQGKRLRVIDFQDALLGPSLYDVASLLTDRWTPRLIDAEMEARLLEFSRDCLPALRPLGKEEVVENYRLLALQRILKVVGRFNFLAEVKGRPSYLEMVPRVATSARRVLEGLEGFRVTRELVHGCIKNGGDQQ